jgi:vacuolar-type H+-ATPase subunit B/Vma2
MESPQMYFLLTIRSRDGKKTLVKYSTKCFSSKEHAEADLRAQKLEYYAQSYDLDMHHEMLEERMCDYDEDDEKYLEYKKVFEKKTLEEYSQEELFMFEAIAVDYLMAAEEWWVTLKPFEYVLEPVRTE